MVTRKLSNRSLKTKEMNYSKGLQLKNTDNHFQESEQNSPSSSVLSRRGEDSQPDTFVRSFSTNFTSFKLICLPIFFERLLLLNGVTGLAKNSVSKETGNGYIKEGSGKTERPPATILLQAAYGLLNSYQGRQGKTETTDTEPGLMKDHRIETLWSLLPTRFIPVYRSNYSKLTSSLARMTSSLTLTQQPSSNKPTPFLVSLPCFSLSPYNEQVSILAELAAFLATT